MPGNSKHSFPKLPVVIYLIVGSLIYFWSHETVTTSVGERSGRIKHETRSGFNVRSEIEEFRYAEPSVPSAENWLLLHEIGLWGTTDNYRRAGSASACLYRLQWTLNASDLTAPKKMQIFSQAQRLYAMGRYDELKSFVQNEPTQSERNER